MLPEKVPREGQHPSRIPTSLGKSWQSLLRYKVAISMPLLRRLQARDRGHPLGKSFRSWDDERVVFRSIRSETLFTDGEPRGFMLALVVGGPEGKPLRPCRRCALRLGRSMRPMKEAALLLKMAFGKIQKKITPSGGSQPRTGWVRRVSSRRIDALRERRKEL
jgi:hypothetical protein